MKQNFLSPEILRSLYSIRIMLVRLILIIDDSFYDHLSIDVNVNDNIVDGCMVHDGVTTDIPISDNGAEPACSNGVGSKSFVSQDVDGSDVEVVLLVVLWSHVLILVALLVRRL